MKILLICYDNSSYIPHFPLGIAYIASVLRKEGHEVLIYNQDVHHYSEEHLTRLLDNVHFDVVGIGSVAGYYPYRKILKISEAVNKSKNRNNFKYIIGGHMVSASPEYFLDKTKANSIVVGEGEESILKALSNDGIISSEQIKDLDKIPSPAYDLFPMWYYRLQRMPNIDSTDFCMSIVSGRGCSFNCSFCYRLTKGIRLRSIENIIEEIKLLKKDYRINYIDFADDLTVASKQRAVELSEALLSLNIKWRCEGRLNYVDKEVLETMKRSGCVFINYGIEALDDKVLANMNKALTVSQIIKGVETTLEVGISPGLNIIFGNIGDTKETLEEGVNFLLKYDDCSQIRTIRPVQPYPGSELFQTALDRKLVEGVEDFYENKLTNSEVLSVNFTELSDNDFYSALYRANFSLLTNYHKKNIFEVEKQLKKIYFEKDKNFRGFRQT
uniref:Putative radical SAM superfamily protein n=1 Tax=viral metagenome TaxID=1070528 RepID=A0A6M3IIJ8_9ZZZZ